MNLNELLENKNENSLSGSKWITQKRNILRHFLSCPHATIAELSVELHSSIPTITKAVNELLAEGYIIDIGKIDNNGGRKPSVYTVVSNCGYLLGVEVNRNSLSLGIQNLKDEFICLDLKTAFILENDSTSLAELCKLINKFIAKSKIDPKHILGACINLTGRINSREGFSHSFFFTEVRALSDILSEKIGVRVYLENDSRAMALGEYHQGVVKNERNIIFVNYSWGVGIGIICEGQLYYGTSGYSGEFGHSPLFNNGILCQCGRTGCLETEISGWALQKQYMEAIAQGKNTLVNLDGIPLALQHLRLIEGVIEQEDSLCIDLISKQSENMGRYMSILLNVFNPDLVVLGGDFAKLGDFSLLPMQAAMRKHSLGLVNQDMKLKVSSLGTQAGVIGACCIVKARVMQALEK